MGFKTLDGRSIDHSLREFYRAIGVVSVFGIR